MTWCKCHSVASSQQPVEALLLPTRAPDAASEYYNGQGIESTAYPHDQQSALRSRTNDQNYGSSNFQHQCNQFGHWTRVKPHFRTGQIMNLAISAPYTEIDLLASRATSEALQAGPRLLEKVLLVENRTSYTSYDNHYIAIFARGRTAARFRCGRGNIPRSLSILSACWHALIYCQM